MPPNYTELEQVVVLLGEAVSDDVQTWGIVAERYGSACLRLTMRDGREYIFMGRRGDGTKAIPRVEPSPDRLKWCSGCNEMLPIGCFNRNRHSPDLHEWRCRDCRNARRRKSQEGTAA